MSDPRQWSPLRLSPNELGVSADTTGLIGYLDSVDVGPAVTEHRALLFTGFELGEPDLAQVSSRLLQHRQPYLHGNSPRTKVGDNIYTSTEFPAEYEISMHNELSYARVWPSRLLFFCVQPAATGGQTPLVHGGLWLSEIGQDIRDAFEKGVIYRQCLHGGFGLGKSWQETFETTERAAVEEYLTGSEAEWEWTASGTLKIAQHRPAIINHPVTGERVWFSQMDQWHAATLGEETMQDLLAILPEDELPQSVSFADGSPIPAEYALRVRETGLGCAVNVDWRRGDLLVIDNAAVGHGRRAFSGSRRILVAMSQ